MVLSARTFRAAAPNEQGRPLNGKVIHRVSDYSRRVRLVEVKLQGIWDERMLGVPRGEADRSAIRNSAPVLFV
jgi:hypothetical protein